MRLPGALYQYLLKLVGLTRMQEEQKQELAQLRQDLVKTNERLSTVELTLEKLIYAMEAERRQQESDRAVLRLQVENLLLRHGVGPLPSDPPSLPPGMESDIGRKEQES